MGRYTHTKVHLSSSLYVLEKYKAYEGMILIYMNIRYIEIRPLHIAHYRIIFVLQPYRKNTYVTRKLRDLYAKFACL